MILEFFFVLYFLIFQFTVIYLGANFLRIRQKYHIHPRILCFILPLIVNYFITRILFQQLPSLLTVLLPCLLALVISLKLEKVRIIGVTGCIASGKSTLIRLILKNYKQIDVIDCDQINKTIRKKGKSGYKLIMKLLGDKADNFIDSTTKQIQQDQRKKLNQYVFTNPQFRKKLTREMGKLILKQVFKKILINIISGKNVMIVDAALLYQTKILSYICFPVALVGCSEQTQKQRLMTRDGYSQQQAKQRIATQMPLGQKKKKTKFYLQNQGSEEDLFQQFSSRIKYYLNQKQILKTDLQQK